MPLLEAINPQVQAALARTGELARDDFAALRSSLPPVRQDRTGISIDRTILLELFPAQQRLWIRLAVQQLAPDLELGYDRTMAVLSLITGHTHGASMSLGGPVWLRIANGILTIFDVTAYPDDCPWLEPESSLIIPGEGTYALPGSGWKLEVSRTTDLSAKRGPLSAILAIGEGNRLELRTRRRGDRFRPSGAGGHSQKLSDTVINMKVPSRWRDRIPILVVGGEIAWFVAPLPQGPRSRVAHPFTPQEQDSRPTSYFEFLNP